MKFILLPSLILLVVPSYAADEEFCTDYVIIAISQYWQSVNDHCGLSGLRWNSDYKKQYQWCLTAHEWVADNEIEARNRMLDECRAAAAEAEGMSPTESADKVNSIDGLSEETKTNNADHSVLETRSLNEKLVYAVAENNIDKIQKLVRQGADLHFVTNDLDLIKKLKMDYHLGKRMMVRDDFLSSDDASFTNGSMLSGDSILEDTSPIVITRNTVDNELQSSSPVSESLVSYAVSKGLVDSGLWLLEQEAYAFDQSKKQKLKNDLLGHALINAVKNKKKNKVQALLEKGAAIDYDLDMNFGTPLYFAVIQGSIDIAEVLLSKGANAKYATNAGQNMLNYALNANNMELLALLLKYGADPDSKGESTKTQDLPLFQAVKQGNIKAVELLMMKGADPEVCDYDEAYPLLQAVTGQQTEIVKLLIKYDVNINVVYNSASAKGCSDSAKNITPLSEAIRVGNKKIVALLEKAGARTEVDLCK